MNLNSVIEKSPKQIQNKLKKVLIISHNHPNLTPGGAEIFAYDLFKAIKKCTDYQPFFLAAATSEVNRHLHGGTMFQTLVDTSDELLFWGDTYDIFYHSQRVLDFMYGDFKDFLRELQPNVIHFQHYFRFGLEAIQIARQVLPEVKIVITLHEFWLMCHQEGQMIRRQNRELCEEASSHRCHQCFPEISPQQFKMRETFIKSHLELVDLFMAPSHFLAKRLINWGIPEEKMIVQENGRIITQASAHRILSKGDKRNVFGFFGQLNRHKGVLLVLQAVKYLIKQEFTDFRLELFGNIATSAGFAEEFNELLEECEGNVTYYGRYEQEEIPELIQDVDWVIVPSTWWENSPLVIQEVFMHKRPIIASNIGGMAEKVENGVTGLHFRVRDYISLAETIKKACSNPELWENLMHNIKPRLSIEACAKKHIELYDNL